MQKLKKHRRSTSSRMQNNEGVRVTGESREDPKAKAPSKPGSKKSVFDLIRNAALTEWVRWCFNNWPFIHEKASAYIDVLMEVFKQ